MVFVLRLAIGVLLICLVGVLVYAARTGWIVRSNELAVYRQRRHERDRGRAAKPIEAILTEDWDGPPIDIARFRRIWIALASYLEIDPELMRPTDRVENIIVSTDNYGPDGEDLVDFFLDFLSHTDTYKVLADVARHEDESVADLILAVISRQQVTGSSSRT